MTQLQQDTIRKLRRDLYESELACLRNKTIADSEKKINQCLQLQIAALEVTKNIWILVSAIFGVSTIALITILLGG